MAQSRIAVPLGYRSIIYAVPRRFFSVVDAVTAPPPLLPLPLPTTTL